MPLRLHDQLHRHHCVRRTAGNATAGGHADFLLAEESTCVPLPDALSYVDGACVACGFGTAYEALCRADLSGRDALLVTGVGPVGLALGLLAGQMGSSLRIGVDVEPSRLELALSLGAIDLALQADDDAVAGVLEATDGLGCEVSVDASGSAAGRRTAILGTRHHGRSVLVGEGGRLEIDVSPALIHPAISLHGSWVTSLPRMEELLHNLVRWELHPETTVTTRFGVEQAADAYERADAGRDGKVAITMN